MMNFLKSLIVPTVGCIGALAIVGGVKKGYTSIGAWRDRRKAAAKSEKPAK